MNHTAQVCGSLVTCFERSEMNGIGLIYLILRISKGSREAFGKAIKLMKNIWKLSLLAVMLVLAQSDSLTLTPSLASNPVWPEDPSQRNPATSLIVIPAVNNAVPLQNNKMQGRLIVGSANEQLRTGDTSESKNNEDDGQKANGGTEEEENSSGESEAAKKDNPAESTQPHAGGSADESSKSPSGNLPENAPQQPNQGAPKVEIVMPANKTNAAQTTDSPALSNLQKLFSNLFGTINQAPQAPANPPNSQIPNPPILMEAAPSSLTADPVKNDTTPQNKPQDTTPQNKPQDTKNDTTPQGEPKEIKRSEEQSRKMRKNENEIKSEVESSSDETWKVKHMRSFHHEEDSSSEIESESQHKKLNGVIFRKHHVHRRHHHGIPQNKKATQSTVKHENMLTKEKQKQVKSKKQSEDKSEKYSEDKSEKQSEDESKKYSEDKSEKYSEDKSKFKSQKSKENSSEKPSEKSSQKSEEISSDKSSTFGKSKKPLLKKESISQGESHSGYSKGD